MGSELTPAAREVLEARYLKRDGTGRVVETPEELFARVAEHVAGAETTWGSAADAGLWAGRFFSVMSSLEFLPNSPALMNAGRELGQLAACFVLPVEDSLTAIFDAVKSTAIIHQSGGGTGFSFSHLRPAGDRVGSSGGEASGPVSFMRVFNAATEAIRQGGMRRGANMGVLRVDHPDIVEFIRAKEAPGELTNFNLSVAVTDAFMDALDKGADYPLVNPRTGVETARIDAAHIFDMISEAACESGEPGVIFIDRVNAANPTPNIGVIEATNPCGEQPLLPYEACVLGSVNLSKMVRPKDTGRLAELDYSRLERVVRTGVRFLDNAIEASRFPIAETEQLARGNRKIGLGVMGLADLLAMLSLPYDSPEAVEFAASLMQRISETARDESCVLAKERGPFPNISGSVFDRPGVRPTRNATVTTIAPTGSLSIIAGCASGIEPFYSLAFTRRVLGGRTFTETNKVFEAAARTHGFYSSGLMEFIAGGGDIGTRPEVPAEVRRVFRTAHELGVEAHINMQAAFQRHTDNAVSKTVNLPAGATPSEVRRALMLAWESGCKGVTVYRTGSRPLQVLTCGRAPGDEADTLAPYC